MTILFASDLDRTLIYSNRSRGPEMDEQELVAIEWKNGMPLTYMTGKGILLFRQIVSKIHFVPVTTRTKHQYERITGLFEASAEPKYAVVSNGAVILEDGKPIPEWSSKVERQLQKDCTSITHVMPLLKPYVRKGFVVEIKQAESWFVYMVIDESTCSVEDIEQISQTFHQQGYTLSHQGKKVYIMPNCINKSAAVEFVRERMGANTVIASGDSVLDHDMVMRADHGFFPSHGEVVRNNRSFPPHIGVTATSGVLAGEEILKRINDLLL